MVILNAVLTAGICWLALGTITVNQRNAAHHDAFCQYLITQEAATLGHPALEPLVPGQLAAIRAEGCF